MALNYLAGLAANLVTVSGNVFSSSSQDTNYLRTNVGVGWPAQPFKFASAGVDDQITVDFTSLKSVDICSMHGHNLDAGITVELRGSTDNFSSSDVLVATMTKASPTFYDTFGSASIRYWRLKFVGTNSVPIEIGEWVLGARSTLDRPQLVSWSYEELMPQSRQSGANVPQVFAVNLSSLRQRVLDLSFLARTYAQRDNFRALLTDTKFGEEPLVIIPDSSDEIIIHGRMPASISWDRVPGPNGGYHRTSFTVEEDPFSVALP